MILTIIGARPQFVKASVVSQSFQKKEISEEIIHTGQHYDVKMSQVFWDELEIPHPSVNLEIGSGNHGSQTAKAIDGIENYILNSKKKYKALLVYGDTNSTLAGALVASKLHIPLIHIESGLRSFNKKMPEEINRICTDHVSDFLFCSSNIGVTNLAKEGICRNVFNIGDVMFDAYLKFSEISKQKIILNTLIPFEPQKYNLLTIHRPSNTENTELLKQLFATLGKFDLNFVFPVHPRLKSTITTLNLPENIYVTEPFSFLEMLSILNNSHKVFTDSGGLQKEAFWAKKPCITLREETEWIETLEYNQNILTGINEAKITSAYSCKVQEHNLNPYGNGDSATQIAEIIKSQLYV
jgi:UDP-GlcNAc3NAcA epimerase